MNRNHLTPEPRTDRNGVTRIRWVKPAAPEGRKGMPAPVANAVPPSDRSVVESAIFGLGIFTSSGVDMTRRASDDELAVLATVVRKYGDEFVEFISHAAFMGKGANRIADVAAVYEPELFNGFKGHRFESYEKAIVQSCELAGCGSSGSGLLTKTPEIIERTRNFIRFCDASIPVSTRALSKPLVSLALGDTGRDPAAVLAVIRQYQLDDPTRIEFVLDGGNPALSDGAL